MEDTKQHVDKLVESLRQQRDELHVKVKLAEMEASDEWKGVEAKFARLEAKAKLLGGETSEAAGDVGAALKLLGEEIREGFIRVARHF
jgi:hypothetical protein